MNTFGQIFRLTSFGESHGAAIGGVVDGMPAGIDIDMDMVRAELARRRPGSSPLVTQRREPDEVEVLSGMFEGKTTGTPIGFMVRNTNQNSAHYDNLRHTFRPSHADFAYQAKYGIRDHRGGGRASARETIARVFAGALAKQVLSRVGISVEAYASRIGGVECDAPGTITAAMEKAITDARAARNSVGGVVTCRITGCPAGLGDPVFGKLQARLAAAMMTIPAAKGFEYGDGFSMADMRGTEALDSWQPAADDPRGMRTATNHSGGIQGGISNGEEIRLRVAFKPVATVMQPVETVDDEGNEVSLQVNGRQDPCVVTRAVPIVEAMAAMVILDAYLLNRTCRID